ncbi:MAG TPA: hypothetical protein VGJ29_21825 [Vicinamibacterales bacterium]|jgi:hypothetical protein
MWKWILDAHRLLGVSVEIIDDQLAPLTSTAAARPVLRGEIELAPTDSVPRAIVQSLERATPVVADAAGVRISSTPIMAGTAAAGAVLVSAAASDRLGERELARAGSLLASALEDQLSRPLHEHGDNSHKISALYQLLHAAIARGSEREVLRTFAEALSIWDEIEVLGYRANLDGRYTLDVLLPGSDREMNPRTFECELPGVNGLRRLSAADRRDLGFTGSGETALVHLHTDGGPWLIAMSSPTDPADRERSDLYVAALGHALNAAVGVEASRLTWAVMQQFVDAESPRAAAARALVETATALTASGGFALFGPDDSPVLAVGDEVDVQSASLTLAGATQLAAAVSAPAPFRAALAMRALDGHLFTRRDVRLFETAVGNFATWLTSATRRLGGDGERRDAARSFDQILDRYAREAHASNDPASLILISPDTSAPSLQVAHAWIKRLRTQLRPTDLAGRLSSGEVAILLLQTPHAGAHIVARRLVRTLAVSSGSAKPDTARIGVASQFGDTVSAEALIERARLQPVTGQAVAG